MKTVFFDSSVMIQDHILILPSCGCSNVDQLTIDLFCNKYCKHIGRLLSDNINMIVSQDPYNKTGGKLASAIDIYQGDIPNIGPSIVLRIASMIPKEKRRILDLCKDIIEFTNSNKLRSIILFRSISSVFCLEQQIRDWPHAIRSFGPFTDILHLVPIEEYDETQQILKSCVFGDLYACFSSLSTIPFSMIMFFVHEGKGFNDAIYFAKTITNDNEYVVPYSWEHIMNE